MPLRGWRRGVTSAVLVVKSHPALLVAGSPGQQQGLVRGLLG